MPRNPRTPSHLSAALAALLALAVTGCGFQLRGAPPVSAALQPLSVNCDGSVPFDLCDTLLTQLEEGSIQVVDAAQAAYRVELNNFSETRRASAIQLDASAAEYDLRQSVEINVMSADDVPVLVDAEVRSSEIYSYDETNVLAKRREEEDLRESLYQRLAQQAIFRLAPLTAERLEVIREDYEAEQQSDAAESP
ncbi:LPS-assembly lipoprotein LptE [Marinobacter fonticola]|uniref:LPS-assembly lipoprotein LptE n=1 Tax=Marinobacter fonticola TaxID=2603215 RepID=UPI0011E771D8|nr:LPS assembly lipoprotein LptE [Marinobacter fonticola]